MTTSDKKKIIDNMDHYDLYRIIMGTDFKLSKAMKSPFRQDNKPSFSIYLGYDKKLKWHDFAYGGGDIYKLVMDTMGVDFAGAVNHLYDATGKIDTSEDSRFGKNVYEYPEIRLVPIYHYDRYALIRDYHIDDGVLEAYDCFAVTGYGMEKWLNNDLIEEKRVDKSSIGYVFVRTDSPRPYYKFWFPKESKEFRYKASMTDGLFFGSRRLERGIEYAPAIPKSNKFVIICAGEKDAMTITTGFTVNSMDPNNIDNELFGICVALSSESANLTWDQYNKMKEFADNIFVMYDNDNPGIENMNKLVLEYPDIIPIFDLHNDYPGYNDYNDIVAGEGLYPDVTQIVKKHLGICQSKES